MFDRNIQTKMHQYKVGRAVMHSFLEREVWGSILGPVKSDTVLPTALHCCYISSKETVLPTALHCCYISSKETVLPGRNDAEMGPINSIQVSAYDIE